MQKDECAAGRPEPSIMRMPRWTIVGVLLALAALTRLYELGKKPLWLDEVGTVGTVQRDFFRMIREVAENDAHPPVFYALTHLMVLPPHARLISEWEIRVPTAFFGILTVIALWLLETTLFPARKVPIASFLLALSAYGVYYSQEARNYQLDMLWLCLSTFFLAQAISRERPSCSDVAGFILASVLALYTFYYSLFFLAAQALAVLALRVVTRKNLLRWSSMMLVPLFVFACYAPVILHIRAKLGSGHGRVPFRLVTPRELARAVSEIALGYNPVDGFLFWFLFLVACVPVVLCLLQALHGSRQAILLLVLFVCPFVIVVFFPFKVHAFQSKHVSFVTPIYFLMVAQLAIASEWPGGQRAARHLGLLGRACALLLVLVNLNTLSFYYSDAFIKEDWPGVCQMLDENVGPDDVILPTRWYASTPLDYYLGSVKRMQMRYFRDPPRRHDKESARRVLQAIGNARVVWVVALFSPVGGPNPAILEIIGKEFFLYKPWIFRGLIGDIQVIRCERRDAAAKKASQ